MELLIVPPKKSVFSQSAPGIFTNVANHIDWIEGMVEDNGGMATCSTVLKSPPKIGNTTSRISDKTPKIRIFVKFHTSA